jgi:hypothetical protein
MMVQSKKRKGKGTQGSYCRTKWIGNVIHNKHARGSQLKQCPRERKTHELRDTCTIPKNKHKKQPIPYDFPLKNDFISNLEFCPLPDRGDQEEAAAEAAGTVIGAVAHPSFAENPILVSIFALAMSQQDLWYSHLPPTHPRTIRLPGRWCIEIKGRVPLG